MPSREGKPAIVLCAILAVMVSGCSRAPVDSGATAAAMAQTGAVNAGSAQRSDPTMALASDRTPVSARDTQDAERWTINAMDAIRLQLMRGPLTDVDTALARIGFGNYTPREGLADFQAFTAAQDALLGDAARFAPEDAGVAWLEARSCSETATTCSRTGALDRLMRLEPDNAAVWLLAAERAYIAGDLSAFDDYLAQAARAGYFDQHFGDVPQSLDRVLARFPMPPRTPGADRALRAANPWVGNGPVTDGDFRLLWAAASDTTWATPFSGLYHGCKSPPPSRRAGCIGALRVMAGADTLMAQSLALAQLPNLTQGTASHAQWRERYRQHLWLTQQYPAVPPPAVLRAIWAEGEVSTLQDWLARQGRTMPPGWLPTNPSQRAVVLGQPPPR